MDSEYCTYTLENFRLNPPALCLFVSYRVGFRVTMEPIPTAEFSSATAATWFQSMLATQGPLREASDRAVETTVLAKLNDADSPLASASRNAVRSELEEKADATFAASEASLSGLAIRVEATEQLEGRVAILEKNEDTLSSKFPWRKHERACSKVA